MDDITKNQDTNIDQMETLEMDLSQDSNLQSSIEVSEDTEVSEKKELESKENEILETNSEKDLAEKKEKKHSNSNKSNTNKSDMKDFKDIEFKLDSLNLGKNSILGILEDVRIIKKRIAHIENVLREQERSQYSPARDLPGINGKYDGLNMITSDGKKIEVPVNYAAKSLLVFGDELKRIEEDGKHAFKIIKKVDRKKIEGVLSKKDGKYVILSDAGTFNLHKSAVEFRNIKQGEWVQAFIPESGPTSDFAAIDKVISKDKPVKMFEVKTSKPDLPQVKPFVKPENLPQKNQNYQYNNQAVSKPQQPLPPKPISPQTPTIPPVSTPSPSQTTPPASPMPKITFSDEDLV